MTEIERLKAIVEQLRSPGGCPWDQAQTHESLKPECIEEAAEVICGINILTENGDAENLKEELGDLLFCIVSLAYEYGIDPESALRMTILKFRERVHFLENKARESGCDLFEMPRGEKEKFWNEAKTAEKQK